jgi:hypothetical protein
MTCSGVDRSGPWWTRSFIENHVLIRASLSDDRVIMVIMCVLAVELLCHAVMGWILVLVCLLPAACRLLQLRLILLAIKWLCYLRTPALVSFARKLGYR